MLKRGMVGLFAVILAFAAFRAVTLAQLRVMSPPPAAKRWTGRPPAPANVPASADAPPPIADDQPAPVPRAEGPLGDDPMGAVDSFLNRNHAFLNQSRKEADESFQALATEAETLRARLRKVESALARWQAVSQALNRNQIPPSPTTDPEPTPQLEAIKPPELPSTPAPPPVDVPPSLPPSSPVPPANDPIPLPVPGEITPPR